MEYLIEELSALVWEDLSWRKNAADILLGTPKLSRLLTQHMKSWGSFDRIAKFEGSHETTTHYKWLIHRDGDRRFTVWLHDYKPASARRPGYAEVPHNHRYDLCSVILNGGYESVSYDVTTGVAEIRADRFEPGDILSMSHDEVHSLREVSEGTRTLFIEGPTIRHFSTAFPPDEQPRDFVDFNGRWPGLEESLNQCPR